MTVVARQWVPTAGAAGGPLRVHVPTVSPRSWLALVESVAPRLTKMPPGSDHTDPLVVRRRIDQLARFQVRTRRVRVRRGEVGGIRGAWFSLRSGPPTGTVLYLHGGGYVSGGSRSHRALVGALVARSGANAFVPDYRLAPEHPFPAALDDARAVYEVLIVTHDPSRLALAGDSAGGGLALALALDQRDRGAPLPSRIALLSPWVDLTGPSEKSERRNATDLVMSPEQIRAAACAYAGPCLDHPLVSPLGADLSGLPELFVQVGTQEIIGLEGEMLAERAAAAGVAVTLELWDRMQHVFHAIPVLPERRRAIERLAAFLVG